MAWHNTRRENWHDGAAAGFAVAFGGTIAESQTGTERPPRADLILFLDRLALLAEPAWTNSFELVAVKTPQ
jgi:hypothetical protein